MNILLMCLSYVKISMHKKLVFNIIGKISSGYFHYIEKLSTAPDSFLKKVMIFFVSIDLENKVK